jgi:hypothetical protein
MQGRVRSQRATGPTPAARSGPAREHTELARWHKPRTRGIVSIGPRLFLDWSSIVPRLVLDWCSIVFPAFPAPFGPGPLHHTLDCPSLAAIQRPAHVAAGSPSTPLAWPLRQPRTQCAAPRQVRTLRMNPRACTSAAAGEHVSTAITWRPCSSLFLLGPPGRPIQTHPGCRLANDRLLSRR